MNLRPVYLIAFFISLLTLIIFYETNSNKINKNYLIMFLTTLISNFGYAMSVYATTLEGAMAGDLVSYVGSIFTILFMLVVVVDMCGKRFYLVLRIGLLVCAIAISVMIGSTKLTNLFYVNPEMAHKHGLTIISYTAGPGMFFYIAYLGVINIAAMVLVIHSIFTKKRVSKRSLTTLLICLIIGTLFYVIPLFLGLDLNLMPYIYIFMEVFFILFSARVNTYDLQLNLINVYKSRGGYGYIAFDNKGHFLGCDDFAIMLFPELDTVPVDFSIPSSCRDVVKGLHYRDENWNWKDHCNQDFRITSNEKSAICTIHRISAKGKKLGFLFELRDDTEQQNYIKGINHYNKELTKLIEEKTHQVIIMQESIIKGMATMVESRDNSTGGHILRTSDCIKIFAEELLKHPEIRACTPAFCSNVIKAAPMHDLGKIAVDDSILRKPGKYTDEEYSKMKDHAAKGAVIVAKVLDEIEDIDFKRIAVNVAHYHHEKWDGSGYPEHLKGTEIPLEARIMALADVFDALVSKRCYKEAKSFDEAFEIIQNDLGRHFDPEIGKIFIQCRSQLEAYYTSSVNEL